MHYFLYLRVLGHNVSELARTLNAREDRPILLTKDGRVFDANSLAFHHHISLGMPIKEAKVILQGDAQVLEYQPEQLEEAQRQFLDPCLIYSDRIHAPNTAEASIDLSPHPNPHEIVASLLNHLHRELNCPIKAGIAPTSWIATRSAKLCETSPLSLGLLPIEPVLNARDWLYRRPVAVLSPLDPHDLKRLKELGLDLVGQVQDAPLARIEEQFPGRGLFIRQVALGYYDTPFQPNYPSQMISASLALGQCQSRLKIDAAIHRLAQLLTEKMCAQDLQARTVSIVVTLESGKIHHQKKNLTKALNTATPLTIVLGQLFQAISIGEPVEQMKVQLLDLTPSTRRQLVLDHKGFDQGEAKRLVSNTLSRVNAIHGTGTVQVASTISTTFNQQVLREWKRVTGWR